MTQIIAGTTQDLQKTPAQYIKELLESNWSIANPVPDFYNSWINNAQGKRYQICVLQRIETPGRESLGRQRSDIDSFVDVHAWGLGIVLPQESDIPELLYMRNEIYRIIREHWEDIPIFWQCNITTFRQIEDQPATQGNKTNWHYLATVHVNYTIVSTT